MAPRSVLTYGRSLKGFALWMQANGGWTGDWSRLTARDLRDFVIERQNTHSRRSVHNQLSAVRAFLSDLRERGGIATTPAAGLVLPKLPKSLPKFLTEGQADTLLDADATEATGETPERRARDQAILEILYGAGLRVSELCGLTGGDLDLGTGLVRVLGKGSKERVVPVGDTAVAAVKVYLGLRGPPARGARSCSPHAAVRCTPRGPIDVEAEAGLGRFAGGPHPAQTPPCLRDAPAGQWRRPAAGAGAAGPRLAFDHADLHPPLGRAAA